MVFKHEYPVCAAVFSSDSTQVFTAGLDNDIHIWDVRKQKTQDKLVGHRDTVTGSKRVFNFFF